MRFFRAAAFVCVVTFALVGTNGHAQAVRQISADDPRLSFEGRTELAEKRIRMGFPGVTLRFVYRGPAPTLKLTGDNQNCFFNLSCNGWDPVLIHLKQGPNEIALPTGTAPAKGWVIELVRRTESWMGTASFDGLDLPAGTELMPVPPAPERRLMFIGDSLTCGEYNERFPPENDDTPRSTNAARSYGMLLARWLHAQVHLVAYGGRGITRDWSGKTATNTVPVFFARAMPDDPNSIWNHTRYTPDVIVINVGTDLDAGLLDEEKFLDAYTAFVEQVRAAHSTASILLCESGFQSDGSDGKSRAPRDLLLRTIKAVVERRRAAGDTRVRFALTGFHPGTPTNSHVVAFQQEQIAEDLLGPLRELAGWK
ncbi:MAG: GDSL-type esterase/lipase family protein [Opitutus sp.]